MHLFPGLDAQSSTPAVRLRDELVVHAQTHTFPLCEIRVVDLERQFVNHVHWLVRRIEDSRRSIGAVSSDVVQEETLLYEDRRRQEGQSHGWSSTHGAGDPSPSVSRLEGGNPKWPHASERCRITSLLGRADYRAELAGHIDGERGPRLEVSQVRQTAVVDIAFGQSVCEGSQSRIQAAGEQPTADARCSLVSRCGSEKQGAPLQDSESCGTKKGPRVQ